jgi:hypothetical protein
MLTFSAFVAESRRLQIEYITTERTKILELSLIRRNLFSGSLAAPAEAYKRAAGKLGYHPLTAVEIKNRVQELDLMEANIDMTHGESAPHMRGLYEVHLAKVA